MNDRAPPGLPDSLDAACGTSAPLFMARIDEAACIGCTLCIAACPFDAIVGAARRLHAVLPALCTGCVLCVAPCPVDCIRMVPAGRAWSPEDARAARSRYDARCHRLAKRQLERLDPAADSPPEGLDRTAATQQVHPDPTPAPRQASDDAGRVRRQQAVAAALARARARRASPHR